MADEQSEYDVSTLRVTRREARAVLDRQIEALNDIDDKAAYTLRLNVLVLGVVLTVASILASSEATPTAVRVVNEVVAAGAVASGFSMVGAVWAYTGTSYRTGVGRSDVRTALGRRPAETEWLAVLLYSYTIWMKRNEQANRQDGFALFVSHLFLLLSMGYYAGGVVYGVFVGSDVWLAVLLVLGHALVTCIVLFVPRVATGIPLIERFRA
ncbi:hypothetical protein NGM10_02890 [Halorussus salilacus]|uniref:hypothetical protein n=1 Tax=Halorussus salilacus TaxID=2953750 RepID=UPI0020A130DF|nr:hypothetical protein [Halorussus salilacus]USZ68694.1 hypothetical protein NGM10_02890 [Halorussus salilacus]